MSNSRLNKVVKLAVGSAAAAAVAIPMTLVSAPAQAATANGCTVVPQRPVKVGAIGGVPIARYSVFVNCQKDRIVQIIDQRWESDAPAGLAGDDYYGTKVHLKTFDKAGAVVLSHLGVVTNTGPGIELTYHRTTFRVATINGVSGWSTFQNSPVLPVAN